MTELRQPEAATFQPAMDKWGVAAAAELEDVRRAELDDASVAAAGEVDAEDGAGDSSVAGNGRGFMRQRTAGMEEVVGGSGDDFVVAVVERDLDCAQFDVAETRNLGRVEGVRPVGAERLEGVMIAPRKIIGVAA